MMIRNLKILGLALVASLAVGALGASAASATDLFTTENGESVLLTGTSHNGRFTITAGSNLLFECTTSSFAGTAQNGASEVTVEPSYTGKVNATPHGSSCSSSIGDFTFDQEGCHYTFTGNTTGTEGGKTDATVWVVCPPGGSILKVTAPFGVVVSVTSQTPTAGGVTYTNEAGGKIKVTATMTGTTFTCAPAFACGLAGIPSHGDNTDYTGSVVITGYEDLDGLPTPVTEGAQVGVSVS